MYRTFASIGRFNQDPVTGKNKLYNLLKVYAFSDPIVKYMQGMNFIAALILLVIDDEYIAFIIFSKLM